MALFNDSQLMCILLVEGKGRLQCCGESNVRYLQAWEHIINGPKYLHICGKARINRVNNNVDVDGRSCQQMRFIFSYSENFPLIRLYYLCCGPSELLECNFLSTY
jgi:hypothetical protein